MAELAAVIVEFCHSYPSPAAPGGVKLLKFFGSIVLRRASPDPQEKDRRKCFSVLTIPQGLALRVPGSFWTLSDAIQRAYRSSRGIQRVAYSGTGQPRDGL